VAVSPPVASGVSLSTDGPAVAPPVVTSVSGEVVGASVSLDTETAGVEPSEGAVMSTGPTVGSGEAGVAASGAIESYATGGGATVWPTEAPEISGAVSLEIIVSFIGAAASVPSSVTGTGGVVDPGASVPGSVPTLVSVVGPVPVAFGVICCGVPVMSVVTVAPAIAAASAAAAGVLTNEPVLVACDELVGASNE
jgi:hypothetical protein